MNIQKLGLAEDVADNRLEFHTEICDVRSYSRLFEASVSIARIARSVLSAPALWYLLAGALLLIAVVSLPFSY